MHPNGYDCDVAIVGAGPYGLAAAAHLRAAGVDTRVFGRAMEFWERHMPRGMLLRSGADCSHIADPKRRFTLERYNAVHQQPHRRPVPSADFIGYGHWFQREVVPDLDQRRVERIEAASHGFSLHLSDGERVTAQRVVVATGLGPFAWRPPQFEVLPATHVSHSFDEDDLSRFTGRRVVVVGAGQSALENAALLHEAGASVEVIARAPKIRWLSSWTRPEEAQGFTRFVHRMRRLIQPFVRPRLDIMGPRFVSWLIAWPRAYRVAPASLQRLLTAAAVRPVGASWLVPRLAAVRLTTGRSIATAARHNGGLRLRLDDGTERLADHLMLATGYRVDVLRYPFLAPELRDALRVHDGYPELGPGFESSIAGLHFLGAPAARTFGPMSRFVVGTGYAARALTRRVTRSSRRSNGRYRVPTLAMHAR